MLSCVLKFIYSHSKQCDYLGLLIRRENQLWVLTTPLPGKFPPLSPSCDPFLVTPKRNRFLSSSKVCTRSFIIFFFKFSLHLFHTPFSSGAKNAFSSNRMTFSFFNVLFFSSVLIRRHFVTKAAEGTLISAARERCERGMVMDSDSKHL